MIAKRNMKRKFHIKTALRPHVLPLFSLLFLFLIGAIGYIVFHEKKAPSAPNFTLLVRMYHGSVEEYWQVFAPSYMLFWPRPEVWPNHKLVLVFDAESEKDHQVSTLLSVLPPYPTVKFEEKPPKGTLCSSWRREGYSRQIYSNFYSDRLTDADYIGIADTDSFFSTKATVGDLFVNGKPRIIGYNGCCTGWERAAISIIPGLKPVGEFMIAFGFPFIVKRSHFPLFRKHVVETYGNSSFEEAFRFICSTWSEYTQYDLLAYYLFYYHRDEYSWHIRRNDEARHPALPRGLMNSDTAVLNRSEPMVGIMKHFGHGSYNSFPYLIYDYICTAANFSVQVGSCSLERRDYRKEIIESVEHNLLTDWTAPTARMRERQLPMGGIRQSPEIHPRSISNIVAKRNREIAARRGNWKW